MEWPRGLFCAAAFVCTFVVTAGLSLATSPRYTPYGDARVLEVQGPNLLKLRLLKNDRVVKVRLLGVGCRHTSAAELKSRLRGRDLI